MITFSYTDGIFYVKFSETILKEDIKSYLLEFKTLKNIPQNVLLLYDLREADVNISLKDIYSISKLSKKATSSYKSVKTAFIVLTPNLTAYTILFSLDLTDNKTKRKVFSTEEAAIEWLKK